MFIVLKITLIACLFCVVLASVLEGVVLAVTYRLGGFFIAWSPLAWGVFLFLVWNVGMLMALLVAQRWQIFPFGKKRCFRVLVLRATASANTGVLRFAQDDES